MYSIAHFRSFAEVLILYNICATPVVVKKYINIYTYIYTYIYAPYKEVATHRA